MILNNPTAIGGYMRRVGFEVEYLGLAPEISAYTIMKMYGGQIIKESDVLYRVKDTAIGEFKIELDAKILQYLAKKYYKKSNTEYKDITSFIKTLETKLSNTAIEAGKKLVPLEIVTPPVFFSEVHSIEDVIRDLSEHGAQDTNDSLLYAFGLHINPEVESLDVLYILRILQSFLLLYPILEQKHAVNITRILTNFIDPFPKEYMRLVLKKDYKPDLKTMIVDYHKYNPTRNRALDMLPLFSYLDNKTILNLYGSAEKINARPTFHYRLPNSAFNSSTWQISEELNTWLMVEKLATNMEMIKLILEWERYDNNLLYFKSKWINFVKKFISTNEI